ncbi:MAG: MATE family efflux transporter [Vicinamibacterales bacterium]
MGLANAAATMVGQALEVYNLIFLGTIGAVFVFLAPSIVGIYTRDSEVARHAVACLRLSSLGFVFYAFGMVLTHSFNSAGDTWTPTWINIGCFWLWEIPLAWLLALRLGFGPTGVYAAVTIAFSTVAVVSVVLFRRGRWKRERV